MGMKLMKKASTVMLGLAMVLVVGLFAGTKVEAATLTSGLVFTSTTANDSGDGWEWDMDSLTLTVTSDGLTIETADEYGIRLPAGATIILEGDLSVTTTYTNNGHGLYFEGTGSITGTGDIYISATQDGITLYDEFKMDITGNVEIESEYGIHSRNSSTQYMTDIIIDGNLTINTDNECISSSDYLTVWVKGDTKITSYSDEGIYASDDANLRFEGDLTVVAEDNGIGSGDALVLYVGGNADITSIGDYGIYGSDSADLTFVGDLSITATNDYGIYAADAITLTTNGTTTIVAAASGICSYDDDIVIENNGNMTITASVGIQSTYGNYRVGSITIGGTGTVTVSVTSDAPSIYSKGPVIFEDSIVIIADTGFIGSNDSVTIGEDATLNAVVCVISGSAIGTIYGNYVPTDNVLDELNELYFAEGSVLTVKDGVTIDLWEVVVDFTNAVIIVEDGGIIYYGPNAEVVYYTEITSLTLDGWYTHEEANVPSATAIVIDDDFQSTEYVGPITYTYSDSLDGTYTSTVPSEEGTYYVKAYIAATVSEYNYVTIGSYAISEFEISTLVIDGLEDDEDTDVDTDEDTDVDTDAGVDTDADTEVPDTGDSAMTMFWMSLLGCSLLSAIVVRKKYIQ